jgi:hypothetical protein
MGFQIMFGRGRIRASRKLIKTRLSAGSGLF